MSITFKTMVAPQKPIFATIKPINLHEKSTDQSKFEVMKKRVRNWCGENIESGVIISLTSGKELAKVVAQSALKDQQSAAKVWNSRPLEERRRISELTKELESLEKTKAANVAAVKIRIELRQMEKNEHEIPKADIFLATRNESSDDFELSLSNNTEDMWR